MTLHHETAVSVCAIRKVQLPAGSWNAGDEDGKALEVLVRDRGDETKLPKTTVHEESHRATKAQELISEQPFITAIQFDGSTVETYSYRFRRYDAIKRTVHTYLCIVVESTDTADSPFKWVPWNRWGAYLTHPYPDTLTDLTNTMQRGLSRYESPFSSIGETTAQHEISSNEHRKLKRKATAQSIRNNHRTLDAFTDNE